MIIAVSGLGRCGTSLMMKLLLAAGFKHTGAAAHPLWEDGRIKRDPQGEWSRDLPDGSVIKWPNPHRNQPPAYAREWMWLWMMRDYGDQQASRDKLAVRRGVEPENLSLPKQTTEALRTLARCDITIRTVSFETLVGHPVTTLGWLSSWVGVDLARHAHIVWNRDKPVLDEAVEFEIDRADRNDLRKKYLTQQSNSSIKEISNDGDDNQGAPQ